MSNFLSQQPVVYASSKPAFGKLLKSQPSGERTAQLAMRTKYSPMRGNSVISAMNGAPMPALTGCSELAKMRMYGVLGCASLDRINRRDLAINLHTAMDVSNVCMVATPDDVCVPYPHHSSNMYYEYVLDPDGEMFGDTPCGMHRFETKLRPKLTSTIIGENS